MKRQWRPRLIWVTLSLVSASLAAPAGANEPSCSPQEREAVLRALQESVLNAYPRQLDSLSDAVRPGGPLQGWFLSHGHVVMANSGAVSLGIRRPGPSPQLLFYAPSPSSRPENWLDFDGPDGPYRLIGWGNLMPYQPGSAPPERRCVEANEWFVHEAGWHMMDGTMKVTPGAREEPPRPETKVPIYYWHPQLWDIHYWLGDDGVPTISSANPRAAGGGLHLPHDANFHPAEKQSFSRYPSCAAQHLVPADDHPWVVFNYLAPAVEHRPFARLFRRVLAAELKDRQTAPELTSMALDVGRFVEARPYAYHLTARGNLESIRSGGRIDAAAELIRAAGSLAWLRRKRGEHVRLMVNGRPVSLRDQLPLHLGNMELLGGWTFEDLVQALNDRVFFWPGTEDGPSDYGQRHFSRYESERPAIIRVETSKLLDANRGSTPEFCARNSGSPRYSGGRPSPRGPATFVEALKFAGGPSAVVELTFRAGIRLPEHWQVGSSPSGPWRQETSGSAV